MQVLPQSFREIHEHLSKQLEAPSHNVQIMSQIHIQVSSNKKIEPVIDTSDDEFLPNDNKNDSGIWYANHKRYNFMETRTTIIDE